MEEEPSNLCTSEPWDSKVNLVASAIEKRLLQSSMTTLTEEVHPEPGVTLGSATWAECWSLLIHAMWLGTVVHNSDPSTGENEAGGVQWGTLEQVQSHSQGLY